MGKTKLDQVAETGEKLMNVQNKIMDIMQDAELNIMESVYMMERIKFDLQYGIEEMRKEFESSGRFDGEGVENEIH